MAARARTTIPQPPVQPMDSDNPIRAAHRLHRAGNPPPLAPGSWTSRLPNLTRQGRTKRTLRFTRTTTRGRPPRAGSEHPLTSAPKQPRPLPARLDYGHFGIRLIPTQAKASTPGHPTGRADPPAGGVPRKLAGRRPGAAIRHPSGTLLCLHVSKPGSDGLELTPLLPLDATRSSPCRRLGYIVTKWTSQDRTQPVDPDNHCREQPGPAVHPNSPGHGPRCYRPNRAAALQRSAATDNLVQVA